MRESRAEHMEKSSYNNNLRILQMHLMFHSTSNNQLQDIQRSKIQDAMNNSKFVQNLTAETYC
jgi:hypothetical protein